MERSRDRRRRDGSRSCTSAADDSAQDKRVGIHGVSEGKKQSDDIPKMGRSKIPISLQGILVQRVLCGHDREEHRGNQKVHSKSVEARQRSNATEHRLPGRPVYG